MVASDALVFISEFLYAVDLVQRRFLQHRVSQREFGLRIRRNVDRFLTGSDVDDDRSVEKDGDDKEGAEVGAK